MCAKLSSRQVCLCALESQAPLAFWSRAHPPFSSLALNGSLRHRMCPRGCQAEWSTKRGEAGWDGRTSGVGRRRTEGGGRGGGLADGRFQSVSLAVAPRRWNARSPLHSLFWEVSPLQLEIWWAHVGRLSEGSISLVVWKRSIKGESQRGRETGNYSTEGPRRSCQAQGSAQTFITSDWKHQWFTGILFPGWQVNSVGKMV